MNATNSWTYHVTSGRWDPRNSSTDPSFTEIRICLHNSTFKNNLRLLFVPHRFDKIEWTSNQGDHYRMNHVTVKILFLNPIQLVVNGFPISICVIPGIILFWSKRSNSEAL